MMKNDVEYYGSEYSIFNLRNIIIVVILLKIYFLVI